MFRKPNKIDIEIAHEQYILHKLKDAICTEDDLVELLNMRIKLIDKMNKRAKKFIGRKSK